MLSNKCNKILSQHIKECLPQIRQQIRVGLEDMKVFFLFYFFIILFLKL